MTRQKRIYKRSGKKFINTKGYVMIYKPEHPNSYEDGCIPEHRYIMSQHLKRTLKKGEVVHHINGDKTDNRIENLELMDEIKHDRLPNEGQFKKGMTPHNKSNNFVKCQGCGKVFHSRPSSKTKTCSHKCKWIYLKKHLYNYPRFCQCGTPASIRGACIKCYNHSYHKNKK